MNIERDPIEETPKIEVLTSKELMEMVGGGGGSIPTIHVSTNFGGEDTDDDGALPFAKR